MKEEFARYGLTYWFMCRICATTVVLALLLLAGIWVPSLVQPAAPGLADFMAGAVAMPIKVKDPLKKSLPAVSVLALSVVAAVL